MKLLEIWSWLYQLYEAGIQNCADVLDGYILKVKTPRKQEALNVKLHFSGHYQCNGVNSTQSVANHHCQFTYLAVPAPGSTGDNEACNQISFTRYIAALLLNGMLYHYNNGLLHPSFK